MLLKKGISRQQIRRAAKKKITQWSTSWVSNAPMSRNTSWSTGTFGSTTAPTSWVTIYGTSWGTGGGGYYTYYNTTSSVNYQRGTSWVTSWVSQGYTTGPKPWDTYIGNGYWRETIVIGGVSTYVDMSKTTTIVTSWVESTSGQTSNVTSSSWNTSGSTSNSTSLNTTINTLLSGWNTSTVTNWETSLITSVTTWKDTQW